MKLDCIGKGGSSRVYKVLGTDLRMYAVKKVMLQGDASVIENYKNEIALLERLRDCKNVIKLIESEINEDKGVILLVSLYS